LPGGMLIGALASILYFADLFWGHQLAGGPSISLFGVQFPAQWGRPLLQIVLFAIIALVTGALGDRLRTTGSALGAVESELRQLQLDTNDILGAIDTGLVTVDDRGRLVYMNVAAEHVTGLPGREFQHKEVTEELDRVAPGLGALIRRTSTTRNPIRRYEIRLSGQNGRERYLGVRTTVLERSHQPWVTAVFQDITDSKQNEELARRAERLQAIAELGASLAHEIKNPLASIRSAVDQLATSRLNERDRDKLNDLVVTESDRLTRLLADFMEFSRIELRRWGAVDLCKVTRDAVGLVQQHPDASGRARFQMKVPSEALFVAGDEDLLHRAVFNLLLNAAQHTGNDGKVAVEVNRVARRDMPGGVPLEQPIRLTVTDTGPGIAPAAMGRIFDPFFTTRDGGTGLGLALVHRAVEAHQGLILVDGAPPHGAKFTVYLPAQAERRV
jgi:two-component system, NtrC family, sensor histidine kinase PilS